MGAGLRDKSLTGWRKTLAEEAERQHYTMKSLSIAAGQGPTYVRDVLQRNMAGDDTPAATKGLLRVCQTLGKSPSWLGIGVPPNHREQNQTPSDLNARQSVAPIAHQDSDELPIYAPAADEPGMIDFATPIGRAQRPAPLIGIRDAYAVYAFGRAMEPAYRQGDMLMIHPHLPPDVETDVIIRSASQNGRAELSVRRLISFTNSTWTVRQYNPLLDEDISRDTFPTCHRIVAKIMAH